MIPSQWWLAGRVFGAIPFNYIAESGLKNWVQRGLNEGDFITAFQYFICMLKPNHIC